MEFQPVSRPFFKDVPEYKWMDYKWQIKNALRKDEDIGMPLTPSERFAIEKSKIFFPVLITPYYFSLIDVNNIDCPVRRQCVPDILENRPLKSEEEDPLCEEKNTPIKGIIHRYPDRIVLFVTPLCHVHCRFCNRRRIVSKKSSMLKKNELDEAISYIENNNKIRDVIVSGGDPLTLSDEKIEYILKEIRKIPSVEIIRIATRAPTTLPFRITPKFCDMIKKYHPIYVITHFNHPKECTKEALSACEMLANSGCVLLNQMVLLKGINDSPQKVMELNHKLLFMRVRPYYIYQCDAVKGGGHFRTSVKKGLEIIEKLRGWTSGFAVPQFVVDTREGSIPLQPDYILKKQGNRVIFRSYKNDEIIYYDIDE